jgi:hypothetical protein
MSELRQIAQHPEADTLNAFAENALPAHDREQTLLHLASCEDCRSIVYLAQEAAAEEPAAQPQPASMRRPWYTNWIFAWPAAAALAAAVAFTIYLRVPSTTTSTPAVTTHASVQPPAPLPPQQQQPSPKPTVQPPHAIPAAMPPAPKLPTSGAIGGMESANANGATLSQQQIENLPIDNRSIASLPIQSEGAVGKANSIVARSAASMGAGQGVAPQSASANADTARKAQPATAASAPPPPIVAAAPTNETVEVAAESAALSVDAATLSSTLASVPDRILLPSHLPASSTIGSGNETLALDAHGKLFRSTDSGQHWKRVHAAWAGQALHVDLIAAAKPSPPLTLDGVLDKGEAAQFATLAPSAAPAISGGRASVISLQGYVTDPTGASIAGATVVVSGGSASSPRTVETDAAGKFAVHGLAPGLYTIQAAAPGFETTQKQTTIATTQPPPLDLKLPVGAATETVMVEGASGEITTTAHAAARQRKSKPAESAPPVFELTTDTGAVWTSSDGLHWQLR